MTGLNLDSVGFGELGGRALLEGVRDSAVTSDSLSLDDTGCPGEILEEIYAVLHSNDQLCFILQLQIEENGTGLSLTFRTVGGNIAAVLEWSFGRPVQDLPQAVWTAMRSTGFQLPCQSRSAHGLKILLPHGAVLAAGEDAVPLREQLGLSRVLEA